MDDMFVDYSKNPVYVLNSSYKYDVSISFWKAKNIFQLSDTSTRKTTSSFIVLISY